MNFMLHMPLADYGTPTIMARHFRLSWTIALLKISEMLQCIGPRIPFMLEQEKTMPPDHHMLGLAF